ncbi:MAG: PHB depolymerase family esterase [Acidimicrobiia bacterium]
MRFLSHHRKVRSALVLAVCAATIGLVVAPRPGAASIPESAGAEEDRGGRQDPVILRGESEPESAAPVEASSEERIPGKLLPPDLGDRERPLIVLLHSYSGRVEDVVNNFAIGQVAVTSGWIIVAPAGLTDALGRPYWNATPTCCDRYLRGNDDVSYLRQFITEAIERYPVDPSRVIVVGLSNGAFMAYRLACDISDLVTAVVAISGVEPWDPSACTPSYPVSVLHVHGIYDRAVSFRGGSLSVLNEVWAPYPSAEETVRRWVDRNGCSAEDPITTTHTGGQAGFWFGCDLGTSVRYIWLPQGHRVKIDVSLVSSIKRFVDHVARAPVPPPSCAVGPC